MSKPKAPRWLTEAFRDGVDELVPPLAVQHGAYPGAWAHCVPAHHDPAELPCSGERGYERLHFIPRQRVENAMYAMLLGAEYTPWVRAGDGRGRHGYVVNTIMDASERDAVILLAAWDPRNGGLGCEHHHRRLDGHATSPRAPKIIIPFDQLPEHVFDFVDDYGFRGAGWLTERFPA